jgi:Transglycosylase SLT domain
MRKIPRKSKPRYRIAVLWPSARLRRRWLRAFQRSPAIVQVLIGLAAVVALCFGLNWVYQVIRKPSELFFPVSGTLNKTPSQTWQQYAPIFEANATRVMTPEFLAALAQVEGSGNPVARTYWRWSWKPWPFDLYRPASSAVGMYQITDGTFAEARRFCIHHHTVVEDGSWNAWHSCWFNRLYTRVVPAHAVELTSAYLDHNVASILERHDMGAATVRQKQELAAFIHLCGAAAGDAHVRRGLKLLDGQHCGDQEVRGYLARIDAMKRVFALLAAEHARM